MTSQKLEPEIMNFAEIFKKSLMKNAHLPKLSILLKFEGEILAVYTPMTVKKSL